MAGFFCTSAPGIEEGHHGILKQAGIDGEEFRRTLTARVIFNASGELPHPGDVVVDPDHASGNSMYRETPSEVMDIKDPLPHHADGRGPLREKERGCLGVKDYGGTALPSGVC